MATALAASKQVFLRWRLVDLKKVCNNYEISICHAAMALQMKITAVNLKIKLEIEFLRLLCSKNFNANKRLCSAHIQSLLGSIRLGIFCLFGSGMSDEKLLTTQKQRRGTHFNPCRCKPRKFKTKTTFSVFYYNN